MEQRIGLNIPPEYIGFLLSHYGGLLIDHYIKETSKNVRIAVQEFYSIYRMEDSYPVDEQYLWLLPFADDCADTIYCFSIKDIDYGKVYRIDFSMDTPPLLLSESFHDFIEGLEKAGWGYDDIWTK
jgi:hypothetical protein